MYFYVLPVFVFDLLCLTPLSAIFQLYRGDQFQWWRKAEYPERSTDHVQATGKLYYLHCGSSASFCNLPSWCEPTFSFDFLLQSGGAVVAVIVCWLDLQLPMQSVHIPLTLSVRTPLRRSVQHYVIRFVSDLQQVGCFHRVLLFPPPIKLTATIYLKY